MKKYFVSVILGLSLAFLACNKEATRESNSNIQSKSIRIELIREIQELPNSLVGLGYQKLNNPEKVVFWNTHVDKYLNTHKVSDGLRNHIELLRDFATVKLYDQLGTSDIDKYVADFTNKWYTIPVEKGLFNAKDLVEIATLAGVGKDKDAIPYSVDPTEPICDCRYNISCGSYRSCYSSTYCEIMAPSNVVFLAHQDVTELVNLINKKHHLKKIEQRGL